MATSGADRALLDALAGVPPGVDAAVMRLPAGSWAVAVEPDDVVVASGTAAFAALDRIDRTAGWWAGFVGYDLGRAVERISPRRPADNDLPDMCFARFDCRLVLSERGADIEGRGPARATLRSLARAAERRPARPLVPPDLRAWQSSESPQQYQRAVRSALDLIAAGDCFQVNLCRRLTCPEPADAVALFGALVREHPAPHGGLVRLAGWAAVSGSPERFLRRDGDRVQTRPIKGTGRNPVALADSEKDRAENVMIVDLARNDLGRVCRYGSVGVPELFRVERHPGLYHLVSTVEGTLRAGVGTGELVRATFPPASVTGAPKPRVLQVIEDLEAVRRGVYCGAVGWLDAGKGIADLNVAIRTFVVAGGATHLGVGAGIVADSDPAAEWRETELKASRLLAVATAGPPRMRSSA